MGKQLSSVSPEVNPGGLSAIFITGAYSPELSSGGLQSRAMARLLRGRVSVQVLTTATDPTLPARDMVDGIPVSRVTINLSSAWSRAVATVRMFTALLRILPRVDLVHIQGYSSKNILVSAMAKLFARPVVLHLQTSRHDEPETVRAQGRLGWWAFSSADHYISVSPGLTTLYLAAGLPTGKMREIPNGVDATRFLPASPEERAALRRQLDLPEEQPLILFVGVMSPDKQPDILLDAWLRMQQDPALASTLVFVGATNPALYELGDRLADRLRADVANSGLGDRVRFVPPSQQIQDYFRAADVFAMPSAREGLPIALLEAMACGLPCVASRLPGATGVMVEDGVNGWLVPPGDVSALADRLAAVLRNPDEAKTMGAAARRTVEERYTMEKVAGQWLDVYRQVLNRRDSSPARP